MPPVFLICPAFCAVPVTANTREGIASSIDHIATIGKAMRDGVPVDFYTLSDMALRLAEAGLFPVGDQIKAMLIAHNLEKVYTAEDIRTALNRILDRCDVIDALSQTNFLIPAEYEFDPSLPFTHHALVEGLAVLLGHAGLSVSKGIVPEAFFSLATGGTFPSSPLRYSARLEDVNPPPDKADVELQVPIWLTPSELIENCDPELLWAAARQPAEFTVAIQVLALRLLREKGTPVESYEKIQFRVGPHFVASLQEWEAYAGGRYSGSVLESCARIAAGIPKYEVKELRASAGSKSKSSVPKVRTSDKAKALRTHVSKDHEALRLMFWKTPNGYIEFANVGPKQELEIR